MKSSDEKVIDIMRKLHEQATFLSMERARNGKPSMIHKESKTFLGTLTVTFVPNPLSSTSTPSGGAS